VIVEKIGQERSPWVSGKLPPEVQESSTSDSLKGTSFTSDTKRAEEQLNQEKAASSTWGAVGKTALRTVVTLAGTATLTVPPLAILALPAVLAASLGISIAKKENPFTMLSKEAQGAIDDLKVMYNAMKALGQSVANLSGKKDQATVIEQGPIIEKKEIPSKFSVLDQFNRIPMPGVSQNAKETVASGGVLHVNCTEVPNFNDSIKGAQHALVGTVNDSLGFPEVAAAVRVTGDYLCAQLPSVPLEQSALIKTNPFVVENFNNYGVTIEDLEKGLEMEKKGMSEEILRKIRDESTKGKKDIRVKFEGEGKEREIAVDDGQVFFNLNDARNCDAVCAVGNETAQALFLFDGSGNKPPAQKAALIGADQINAQKFIDQLKSKIDDGEILDVKGVAQSITNHLSDIVKKLQEDADNTGQTTAQIVVVVGGYIVTVSIGDSEAFLLSKKDGKSKAISLSHEVTVNKTPKESGGSLDPYSADLRNFRISVTKQTEGLLFTASDGVGDNLDSKTLYASPKKFVESEASFFKGKSELKSKLENVDKWDEDSTKLMDAIKDEFKAHKLSELYSQVENDDDFAAHVHNFVHERVKNLKVTQFTAEGHPDPQKTDADGTGKPDHAAIGIIKLRAL